MAKWEMIYDGRWSKGERSGSIFRKTIKYPSGDILEREVKNAQLAKSLGINTPKYLDHRSDRFPDSWFIDYQFCLLERIPRQRFDDPGIMTDIVAFLEKFSSYGMASPGDLFWVTHRLPHFLQMLKLVDESGLSNEVKDFSQIGRFLEELRMSIFVHGDFSLSNLFLCDGRLMVVDFQDSCVGPENWDLCYFLATTGFCKGMESLVHRLDKTCCRLIVAICLIRLGRCLQKKEAVGERLNLWRTWQNIFGNR